MSTKKRGLGRGLDALLGATREPDPLAEDGPLQDTRADDPTAASEPISRLPVEVLRRGRYQPRREFDQESLKELADSIAAQGIIQPVVVRPADGGRYELIAGERRWRAAQLAGLRDIPVVIREVDEQSAIAIGLIENIQRDDLNPLEEAFALQRLGQEFGLTHQSVADAIGKSRTTVTNLLRLLELNDVVKTFVEQGQLEMGHARALLGLKGPAQSAAAVPAACPMAMQLTVLRVDMWALKSEVTSMPAA